MGRLKKLIEAFDSLPDYNIEIGIPEGDNPRKKDPKASKELTNAKILFINENGSPLRGIPARPVLKMTIEWAIENLLDDARQKAVKAFIKSGFDQEALEKEFEIMADRMEQYAREAIMVNDGRFAPNAPSTIAQKAKRAHAPKGYDPADYNHPLFDTGQLAKAIRAILVKK